MIKDIKTFYKTAKQSKKDSEYILHLSSSFVGYIIFDGIYPTTKNNYIVAILGTYFLCRFMYLILKDNIKS
jgi:hypothetical protein